MGRMVLEFGGMYTMTISLFRSANLTNWLICVFSSNRCVIRDPGVWKGIIIRGTVSISVSISAISLLPREIALSHDQTRSR